MAMDDASFNTGTMIDNQGFKVSPIPVRSMNGRSLLTDGMVQNCILPSAMQSNASVNFRFETFVARL